jgi:hypothetical protein
MGLWYLWKKRNSIPLSRQQELRVGIGATEVKCNGSGKAEVVLLLLHENNTSIAHSNQRKAAISAGPILGEPFSAQNGEDDALQRGAGNPRERGAQAHR